MRIGGFKRKLLVITVLGFLVRFGFFYVALPVRFTGDEVYFAKVATNIASGQGHVYGDGSRASWPPGNAYYLSWFVDPDRSKEGLAGLEYTVKMMMLGQVIMGALLVPLLMALSRSLFDDRIAAVAGIIAALYPTLIAYSHYLWAENVFVVLVVAGLVASVYAQRASSFALAALGGVFYGLATLCRETGLAIAAACGIWWVWTSAQAQRRRALLRAGVMLFVAGLVIIPWTVRNYRVLGGFVPISTIGWMAIAEGNTFGPHDWLHPNRDVLTEFRTSWRQITDEVARMEFSRRFALDRIKKEQPTWILKKLVRTWGLLFSPDSFLFKKISRGAYGKLPMTTIRLLLVLSVSTYMAVMVAGILGVATVPNKGHRLLPILVAGSIFVLHVAAFTSSRHRLPIIALLIPYASYALINWRQIPGQLGKRGWIAPAVLLLLFFGFCVPYFFHDAISLWVHGTYVIPWRP